jgi:uncharacterized protein (DUF1800 family)
MSSSAKAEAVLALHRFGMGPRPGSIAAIEADPRGALIAELDRPAATEIAASSLPSSAKAFRTVNEANAKRQAKAIVAKKEQDAKRQQMVDASTMTEGAAQGMGEMAAKIAAEAVPDPGRPIYLEEAKVRIEAAFGAEIGFAERLVWFWSNHFCVSADKIRSMSGAYEREAIRPHVLGRFTDLLLAAEGHPAMLFYLDQTISMGANSIAGINRTRGLNENLAREILELHTLGVRSGYTQDDVIAFANVLTGWTLVPPGDNPEHGGEFTFNPRLHEPGAQRVLGKSYGDETGGARTCRAPRSRCATRHRRACGYQAGAPFHCRRSSAGAGRADGEGVRRYRRRSQGGCEGNGVVRRSLDATTRQTQAPKRVGGRHGAGNRDHAGKSQAVHGWAGAAR